MLFVFGLLPISHASVDCDKAYLAVYSPTFFFIACSRGLPSFMITYTTPLTESRPEFFKQEESVDDIGGLLETDISKIKLDIAIGSMKKW